MDNAEGPERHDPLADETPKQKTEGGGFVWVVWGRKKMVSTERDGIYDDPHRKETALIFVFLWSWERVKERERERAKKKGVSSSLLFVHVQRKQIIGSPPSAWMQHYVILSFLTNHISRQYRCAWTQTKIRLASMVARLERTFLTLIPALVVVLWCAWSFVLYFISVSRLFSELHTPQSSILTSFGNHNYVLFFVFVLSRPRRFREG